MWDQEIWLEEKALPLLEDYERMQPLLETGVFYGLGRDKNMVPNLVFNVSKAVNVGMNDDDFAEMVEFLTMYSIINATVEGKVETLNLVVDMADVGLIDLPMSQLITLQARATENYKMRMNKIVIINTPWMVKTAIKFMSDFAEVFGSSGW